MSYHTVMSESTDAALNRPVPRPTPPSLFPLPTQVVAATIARG